MSNVVTFNDLERNNVAKYIANRWELWDKNRIEWQEEQKSVREYLFATDTRKTENKKLPWKNSTVTPKLTQIRDNLHANYMAALFPSEEWFDWRFDKDPGETEGQKAAAIKAYMQTKLRQITFPKLVSELVLDYIDYGNVFVGHEWVHIQGKDSEGNPTTIYRGPKPYRISPNDIVFNPTTRSFAESPKIVRTLKSYAQFLKEQQSNPDPDYEVPVMQAMSTLRNMAPSDRQEYLKNAGYIVDGFSSLETYFESGTIEFLEFYGDLYDEEKEELHTNKRIIIVDRRWILAIKDLPQWTEGSPFFHVGWRLRPDNLWAQGPLAQLVGMQYRVDHLENLKADVFDQIALPIVKITGNTVDNFEWKPGEQINCGTEGDVIPLHPDATALNADMQIANLLNLMEELAGAPRQAMGIRTPGEKTKYEVQVLENGAGRIFQNKAVWFETNLLEPLINSMLHSAVQNFGNVADNISIKDPKYEQETIQKIHKEDIDASGKLYPVGARHFAEKAKFVQELTTTLQIINQDPSIKAHWSGLRTAKALQENLGFERYGIVQRNIGISEQVEVQRAAQAGQEQLASEAAADPEFTEGDRLINENSTQQIPPEGTGEEQITA